MDAADLQQAAKDHLWLHFTRHGSYTDGADVPVIVRGESRLTRRHVTGRSSP